MVAKIAPLPERLPIDTRHFMEIKLVIVSFLKSAKIDEIR
jgi:hypothetical protein